MHQFTALLDGLNDQSSNCIDTYKKEMKIIKQRKSDPSSETQTLLRSASNKGDEHKTEIPKSGKRKFAIGTGEAEMGQPAKR